MSKSFPGTAGYPLCIPHGSRVAWTLFSQSAVPHRFVLISPTGEHVIDAKVLGAQLENVTTGELTVHHGGLFFARMPDNPRVYVGETFIYRADALVARSFTFAGSRPRTRQGDAFVTLTCLPTPPASE